MDRNTEIHPQQHYHQQQQVYRPVTMPYFSGQQAGDTFEVPSDLVIENKNVQHYQQYHQNPNQQVYYTREVHYPPSEPTHQYSYSRQEFTHGDQVPTQQTQFSTSGKQFQGRIDIPVSRPQQQPTRPSAYPDPQNKSTILDEIQAIESGHADESVYRQEIPIGNFNKLSVSETQRPTAQMEHWGHEQTNAHRQIQQSSSPSRQLYQSYPDSYQQYGGGDYPYEQDRFETNFSNQHGNRPEDVAQPPYEQYQYQPYQQQHMQGQHFQHITTEDTGWGKSEPYDGHIPSGPPPVFTTGPQVSPPMSYRTAAQMRRAESERAQRHHSPAEGASERGYLFGGMDFINHSDQPVSTNPQDYELSGSEHRSRRATTGSPGPPRRPGDYYGLDYTVFIPGEQPPPAGDEANYKGYKAQKPRKHWHFSADPQAIMLNNFEVEVVEGVDPVRLVGDTLSNQKVPVERELTEEEKNNFCTTYAPPSGFKPEHRTVRPEPKSPEPICFSLSVNKHLAADQSSTPGSQQQTCLPNRGPHAPLSGQNSSWYATGNKEIMRNEPNWARNVNQRRYAWENNTRSADSRLYLPSWAKVPPQQPPTWANRANATHNKWQTAANQGYIGSGNYNTGYNYTVSDSAGGEQQEPQEVPTKTIYYNQPLPQHQKTQAVKNQQNRQQEQNLEAESQQTKQSDEIEVQVEPQEELQQTSHLSIKQQQQQQTTFAPKQAPSPQITQKMGQGQIRPQQQQKFVQQQQAPSQNLQQQTQMNQQKYQQEFQQPSGQQWQQQTGAVTRTAHQQQQQHPQIIYEQTQANRYPQQSAAPQSKIQHYGQAQLQPQSPSKQQVQNVQFKAQPQNRVGPQPAQSGHYFRNQLNQPLSNTRPGTIKNAGVTSAGNAPESKAQESNQQPPESQPQIVLQSDGYDVKSHYNVKEETNYSGQPHGGDRQPNMIERQQQIIHHGQPNQSQHPHQQQQYYSSVQQQYYSPQPQRRAQPQPTQHQQRHQNIATTRQQHRETWFTGQPAPIGHQPANNVQQQSQQNPQYQIRAEMSENLPPGQLSYSYTNTSGNFPDKGHGYVNYSREVSTATNPGGQEWQLLKQQESRVLEEPIAEEPGMMASF